MDCGAGHRWDNSGPFFDRNMQVASDPPSLQQVFQVISDAASQNYVIAQAASQQIDSYKTIGGFYASVQEIAMERNLPLDIRKMAIFQFKNGAPMQWRRTQYVCHNSVQFIYISNFRSATRLYPESIKQNIRVRMFAFLDEPDDIVSSIVEHAQGALTQRVSKIAQTNAIAVAKISRIDYPRQWYAQKVPHIASILTRPGLTLAINCSR
jgi:hypothetical protein